MALFNDRFDDILLLILNELQTTESLLHAFFNFLKRRTDFYEREGIDKIVLDALLKEKAVSEKLNSQGLNANQLTFGPEELQVPEAVESQEPHTPTEFIEPGENDAYRWTQTECELRLKVSVPLGTKAKDLKVRLETESLELALQSSLEKPILRGRLCGKIKPVSSLWMLEGEAVVLTLAKVTHGSWSFALRTDCS